ncbi:MAG: hypothetical protein V1874_02205 [Spirochaetota bacterium]
MDTENKKKYPVWNRIMDIVFRTIHVGVISILFGGMVFGVPHQRLVIWGYLVIITGFFLVASEIYHRLHWINQIRGIMVILHAGLFGVLHFYPDLAIPFLTGAIIFGMAGSHMPKRFRCYSLLHKRMLD